VGDRTPTAATAHVAAALLEGIRTGRPPHLLLMHLALQMPDEAAARAALESAVEQAAPPDVAALAAVAALWARRPDAFALVRDVLAKAGHDDVPPDSGTAVAGWRATFDALAREQPEAGVALYSPADPALLAAASREIIDALLGWGDLHDGATVLDLGCGIGRLAAPLSASADFIIGVDVSQVMLAEARRRAGAGSRLGLACLSGLDLAALSDAAFDLVLAVDVFPYLMQAGGGLAERHLLEIPRPEAGRPVGPGQCLLSRRRRRGRA
jgi:predicted TPR repeat methyltransferase